MAVRIASLSNPWSTRLHLTAMAVAHVHVALTVMQIVRHCAGSRLCPLRTFMSLLPWRRWFTIACKDR